LSGTEPSGYINRLLDEEVVKRTSIFVLAIALISLFINISEIYTFLDFNDCGSHNIDYWIDEDVRIDYDAPGMETRVNILYEDYIL
jgi:hypothetical protein